MASATNVQAGFRVKTTPPMKGIAVIAVAVAAVANFPVTMVLREAIVTNP